MRKGFLSDHRIRISLMSGDEITLRGTFDSVEKLLEAAIRKFERKLKKTFEVGTEFTIVQGTAVVDSATYSTKITGPLTLVPKTITPTDEPPPPGDDYDSDELPPLGDDDESDVVPPLVDSSSSEEDDDAV